MTTSTTIIGGAIYDISVGRNDIGDSVLIGGKLNVNASRAVSGAVVSAGCGALESDGARLPTATVSSVGIGPPVELTGLDFPRPLTNPEHRI